MTSWIEWFGMLASVLVAASLTLKNIKRLRIVNLAGSAAFAAYGLLIGAWPVLALNLFTVSANLYYLYRMYREAKLPETFDTMLTDPCADEYARRFLLFHAADIRRFNPSFDPDPKAGTLVGAEGCFILRGMVPVSLVAYRREPNGEFTILLDYAVPAYRDMKNAVFFFRTAASKIAFPGAVFHAVAEVPAHEAFLRKLGFRQVGRTAASVLFTKTV